MNSLKLFDFNSLVKKHGLVEVIDRYSLRGTDISFKFKEMERLSNPRGYVLISGPIPMELAEELYNEIKEEKEMPIHDLTSGGGLNDPRQRAKHPGFNIDKLVLEAQENFKNPTDVVREQMQRMLDEDYESCYVDSYYTSTYEGLDWFILRLLGYYKRKKEELIK